jgi:hypothetical protein
MAPHRIFRWERGQVPTPPVPSLVHSIGNCRAHLALKLSGSRNRGDPTGISQPVEKLLDVDGTDIDERIFAIVWSRLLPDYQLIEAIEVDRRGALTAQCHAGIAAPVEFVVIILRLRAGA